MDALSDDGIEEIVFMASSQVGKSEVLNNALGRVIHLDPGPAMLVQPRIEDAENYSKGRIAPMIRDCPVLASRIGPIKSRDSGNSILIKNFPGGRLRISGANAPASLASDSVRYLFMDEVDRFPLSSGTEGDPYMLARKRTVTFRKRKKVASFSSPTEEATSRILKLYRQSDQREYFMPCPHCEKMITFQWKQASRGDRHGFVWEEGKPETVVYICPECDATIDESHKRKMLASGKWIAQAPFKGIAGFRIWEAYSPWVEWRQIAEAFLKVKDYPESLKVWVNTSLGECWVQKDGDIPDWKRIYDRREKYEFNSVPDGVQFLTAGVDVQADRLEVEVVGWGRDLESWSICYRVLTGDTSKNEVWDELKKIASEQWMKSGGTPLAIKLMGVDSGFNTQRVYNWVRKFPINRVIATKGSSRLDAMYAPPKPVDVGTASGKRKRRGLKVWHIGVDVIKSELMGFLRAELPGDDGKYPPGFMHFPQYGEDHFKQLMSEHIEQKRDSKGFGHWEWVKHNERNEQLDCRVIAHACAAILGIYQMKEKDWDRLKPAVPVVEKSPVASGEKKSGEERRVKKKRESNYW
jgi:phage terminase large subunit GpA-like protein